MIECDVRLRRGTFLLDAQFSSTSSALALFGRSGSGKSTLIGLLAGLLRPDSGRIVVAGRTLVDTAQGVFVPAHKRRIGVVFQDSQLFPHLSVRNNLLYAGWFDASVRTHAHSRFDEVIGMLGIEPLLTRQPGGLSGGEKQRVAIGRALLAQPALLLLDEPLASLDHQRKLEIMPYIERLNAVFSVPIVYVSHALDEVVRIAGSVVALADGKVTGTGSPMQVLGAVAHDAGGDEFGAVAVIEANVRTYEAAYDLTLLDHPAGSLAVPGRLGPDGSAQRVLVRATDVALSVQRPRDVSFRTVLTGTITRIDAIGTAVARVELALRGNGRLLALVTRQSIDELALDAGDEVFAMVKAISLDQRALAFLAGRP